MNVVDLDEAGTVGNLSSGAHLAAIAIGYGADLVSFDADLGRFRRVRWVRPETSDGSGR